MGQELPSRLGQSPILISKYVNWGLQVLLLITAVCIFVPFSPEMPGEGLDPSWKSAMNQAVDQGLAFGREMVFTFGPYASIYTKTYHPATDHLMVGGSLYLGLSFWLALFFVTRNSKWYLQAALLVVLAGFMYSRDALLFLYPLLVGIFCFESVNSKQPFCSDEKPSILLTAVLFFPFGLLPLIKGSVLIMCGAVMALAFFFFAFKRRWVLAIAVLASPLFSVIVFWVLSGQLALNLPSYFLSMVPIISGYTEAMATGGAREEVAYYIVASSVLLAGILLQNKLAFASRIFLLLVFFVYLFLAFKGGFVRHDGHAMMAQTALLFASLLFVFVFHSRLTPLILFSTIFVWLYIDGHYVKTSTEGIARNIGSTYSSAWRGINFRAVDNEGLEKNYKNALQELREKSRFPLLAGTTDIYSYNQSYLIASGNDWNPRPVLQSYSVYTASLAEANRKHLLGKTSPDNIIFRVEPIDGRIPSIEDGASWIPLLTRYKPSALEDDFLYLRKNALASESSEVLLVDQKPYSFGDVVRVPRDSAPIFAEISIKQSALGKLASILYKPSQLRISLNLEGGVTKSYRVISGMAKSGLLISPLIENTAEFGLLYVDIGYLSDKKVVSFSIAPVANEWQWVDTYEVMFKKTAIPSQLDLLKLYKVDQTLTGPGGRTVTVAEGCDGSIDSVNGISPSPAKFSASGLLTVNGWLATSIDQGLLPESVLLVLRDDNGKNTFIRTRKAPRPDVGMYFKKPVLDSSGYASSADVSGIVGNYTLGLAFVDGDHIKVCPKFKISGTFKGRTSHE